MRRNSLAQKDAWTSFTAYNQVLARYTGDQILGALRSVNGGIVYIKATDYVHVHFVDTTPFYRFNLVPQPMVHRGETKARCTYIGSNWVRQEALDLLGYKYDKTSSGSFAIQRDVEFVSNIVFP